jgi:hypothetical protein
MHCPQLRKLILECNPITDRGKLSLGGSALLQAMLTHDLSRSGVEAVCRWLGNGLLHLNLSFCQELTDNGLQSIGKHCRQLVELELFRCVLITDTGIPSR